MGDVAIRVQGLSKQYRIGKQERYRAFRDVLTEAMYAPFRRVGGLLRGNAAAAANLNETIWALKDVSFEVKKGDVVGIIGRNGAGKSTLLKVLSQITEPTEGQVDVYGRVGALLEVGTGFHPELTGRENIYLNGAILGMSREEIRRKFDEIVAFAEVEKFIDTPVKHYSSGMGLRLGFAVAAHMEPEILVVDEVLAVGDAAFQKKCLGKMGDVAEGGRTVLFVSHQMNAIRKLCNSCVWLDAGQLQMIASTPNVLGSYEAVLADLRSNNTHKSDGFSGHARFLGWEIVEPNAEQLNALSSLGPVTFKFPIQVNRAIQNGTHGIALRDLDNQIMWGWAQYNMQMEPGIHDFVYTFPDLPLRPGVYSWLVSLYNDNILLDAWQGVPELIISTAPLTHPRDEWAGILNLPCEFRCVTKQSALTSKPSEIDAII